MKKFLFSSLLFLLIFAGGIFLRVEGLNRQPYWMDEGYTINAVLSGMQNGTQRFAEILDSGSPYFCPMYCTPTKIIIHALGTNDAVAYRAVAVLFGILFVLLSFFLAKQWFRDTRVALLTLFFTAFSSIQIAWSRQARWYTELEFFFWLALTCFYGFLKETRRPLQITWITGSVIFTILAILIQPVAYALPLIMLAWYVIEKRPRLKHILIALLCVAGFAVIMDSAFGFHTLTTNLASHFALQQHFFLYGSYVLRTYWPFAVLAGIGFAFGEKTQRRALFLLITPFFAYLFGLSFFADAIEYRYLFHTTFAWYVLASYGIVAGFDAMRAMPTLVGPHPTLKRMREMRSTIQASSPFIPASMLVFLIAGGQLIFFPKPFYWLEADNPTELPGRDYYAYTPQPDWNQAYNAIKREMQPGDIVTSSHPHFNKIFLDTAGYWLAFDYSGDGALIPKEQTNERYVNATVIHDLDELKAVTSAHHGFIVFDFQSTDNRLPKETIDEIEKTFTPVFFYESNSYSKIWVYRF